MLVSQNETTTLVDPQLEPQRPILRQLFLQREQVLVAVDDVDLRVRLDVTRRDRAWLADGEFQLPWNAQIAQPGKEDSMMRRVALPRV
jgi:hypothetical protein